MGDNISEPASSNMFCASFVFTLSHAASSGKTQAHGCWPWKLQVQALSGGRESRSEWTETHSGHVHFNDGYGHRRGLLGCIPIRHPSTKLVKHLSWEWRAQTQLAILFLKSVMSEGLGYVFTGNLQQLQPLDFIWLFGAICKGLYVLPLASDGLFAFFFF